MPEVPCLNYLRNLKSLLRLGYQTHDKFNEVEDDAKEVLRMINALIDSLKAKSKAKAATR